MLHVILLVAAAGLGGPGFDEAPAVELRYKGALIKATREAEGTAVKRFSLYCAVTRLDGGARRLAFVVSERGAGGWSWPERFGVVEHDRELAQKSSPGPRLLYDYEGSPVVVSLPSPLAAFAGKLKPQARWAEGKETWEVVRQAKVFERDCWQIQVSTAIGRKRTLWVDTTAPIVVAAEEAVFVGQGDEHRLSVELESAEPLEEEALRKNNQAVGLLETLKTALARPNDEFRPELSEAQLQRAAQALPELAQHLEETPYSALAAAIARDVKSQQSRTDQLERLQEKLVGKPSPEFKLTLIDKSTLSAKDLRDRIVVLHFWEYQAEPLVEPYGQVGYLDFLSDRRKKLGVDVIGVAVDERFADPQQAAAALKSVQRLKNFMNLGYPIATDDGGVISRFGDPRRFGAKLPLYVVIGSDGTVESFHAGLYKIVADEGLRELDEILVKLIRKKREQNGGG
jgi:peroxiredoxin